MNRSHRGSYVCGSVLSLILLGVTVRAATSFEPYGVILERKPFGEETVIAPTPLPTIPPEQSVVNQIRMSAVVRDNDGVLRVGLVDLKSNRNYMLGIGESAEEIEVVEADYATERARLRRGPEDYWVSMFGGSNRFEKVTASAPPASEPVPALKPPPPPVDQKLSYAKRRQQREQARLRVELERLRAVETEKSKAAAATAPGESSAFAAGMIRAGRKRPGEHDLETALSATFSETNRLDLSDEELGQMLQEYQKDLLRRGQTPLPIPLTPETDRQLVEEGILLPQEE